HTTILGEAAWVWVETPDTYSQQYGRKQRGAFIDIVQPVFRTQLLEWTEATFNVAFRVDYVDWNMGTFKETGTKIGDELVALTPAVSFRPTQHTVFRVNYRYQWQKDVLNNPAIPMATWYAGFSTYF